MEKKIEVFDSTLRDGAQGETISFSVEDKLIIVRTLDEIGIDYIEAGNPGSNPKDIEFFRRAKALDLKHSKLVAFGSTRRKNSSPERDENCMAVLEAGTEWVSIFGKSSIFHVAEVLRTTPEENLNMIRDTCNFFKSHGKKIFFDAEHFFDGYCTDGKYSMAALAAAVDGGADCLVLCDTNGGVFPHTVEQVVGNVCREFSDVKIGIHCHNDCGMAVANTIIGVEAGADHVQGTYLGFGERCGNANLSTVIANLQLKLGYSCIPPECMTELTHAAHTVAETSNIMLHRDVPYVGRSAFAHKAGMHADGVIKCSGSFEHIEPETVGNHRRFLTSEMSGKTTIFRKIHKICPDIKKDDPIIEDIIEELKELEYKGYQFEGAEGSFELIVLKKLGRYKPFFGLVGYKILGEQPYENGQSATATLKLNVGQNYKISAGEGEGPVNALDKALRESLSEFYPELKKVHLIDYKVRVIESKNGTAARIRVLITSTDGSEIWTTIGVSNDVIEASWYALVDSLEVKLSRTHYMH